MRERERERKKERGWGKGGESEKVAPSKKKCVYELFVRRMLSLHPHSRFSTKKLPKKYESVFFPENDFFV
jgi:hypothetical protein